MRIDPIGWQASQSELLPPLPDLHWQHHMRIDPIGWQASQSEMVKKANLVDFSPKNANSGI
jgi:hypothetical protein